MEHFEDPKYDKDQLAEVVWDNPMNPAKAKMERQSNPNLERLCEILASVFQISQDQIYGEHISIYRKIIAHIAVQYLKMDKEAVSTFLGYSKSSPANLGKQYVLNEIFFDDKGFNFKTKIPELLNEILNDKDLGKLYKKPIEKFRIKIPE